MKKSLIFSKKSKKSKEQQDIAKWRVLIVDDEERVHSVTRLVLKDFVFEGKKIEFLSAYSGEEAKEILSTKSDIALILLDVVMEEDDSGLEVVKYIREELKNRIVRIVLRTGQPGQAPEERVIVDYDINDYKEKTELTKTKLFTTVLSSLRSWRDLYVIEKNKEGLEKIINASSTIFNEQQSLKRFASGVLTQLISILNLKDNSLYARSDGFSATESKGDLVVIAGTGKFENFIDGYIDHKISKESIELIDRALAKESSILENGKFIGYFCTKSGIKNILFLEGCFSLTQIDKKMIDIFSSNVSIAFENFYLSQDIKETQKEVVHTLSEVIEQRCEESGQHVQRVAKLSYDLAIETGLPISEAKLLKEASPMHDIGKIGIADSILLKPDRLSKEEFEAMKSHTVIGYNIFEKSNKELLKVAAIVAHQHHERYDGSGYPQGLKGDEIHIFGRVTAIADVYDALTHKRVYKDAWSKERAIEYLKSERGRHFDPKLVDIFIERVI